jgi:prepilin peptidase CpaA
MILLDTLRMVLFPAVMAFAASSDLLTMTISNRVSLILAAGFAVLAPLTGLGLAAIGSHVAAAAVVLALGLICFARGWVGGGDVKLAAMIALWLGVGLLPDFLLLSTLFGGALTLMLLAFRTFPLPLALVRMPWVLRLHEPGSEVPYGIALALAALVIYPSSVWMKSIGG